MFDRLCHEEECCVVIMIPLRAIERAKAMLASDRVALTSPTLAETLAARTTLRSTRLIVYSSIVAWEVLGWVVGC